MKYSTSKLARYLKMVREKKGIKKSDIARMLGVSVAYISMMESGKRLPSIKLCMKMATLLDGPVEDFLSLLSEDIKEKNETPEDLEIIAKVRFANLYRILFSPFSSLSFDEMYKILEEKYPEKVEVLYKKAIEEFPELHKESKKKAIKMWLIKTPTVGEKIRRNIIGNLGTESIPHNEMIQKIKEISGWTWEGMGGEFGVSGRTVQRWVKGETKIPERAKKRLEYLYYVVYERIKKFSEPLIHLYSRNSGITPEIIFRELEEVGLAEEIKKRIIRKQPRMRKFFSKSLSEFFFEYTKRAIPIQERLRMNMNAEGLSPREKRTCMNSQKILPSFERYKKKNKNHTKNISKNPESKKKNKEKENSGDDSTEEDSGDGDDSWILKKQIENRKINKIASLIFDNLRMRLGVAGWKGTLRKEDPMKLYKRGNSPYFYVDLSVNGKRIRKSTRCRNKRDAETVKSLLLLKFLSNQPIEFLKQAPSLGEVSRRFVEHQRKSGKVSWRREEICHYTVVPYLGKLNIDQINTRKIQEVIEKIREKRVKGGKKISPRSVDYIRSYLHRVFEYAIKIEECINSNPVDKVPPVKYDNKRKRILTLDEEKKLLPCIKDELIRKAVEFALETGLREGEILTLRKSNFHREEGLLYFKIQREKNKIWTEFPVVSERLHRIVEELLSRNTDKDELFCYADGTPLTRWKLLDEFKKGLKKAQIQNLCFNDLRRTFYRRLKLAGCDFLFLEYLMGHKLKELPSKYFPFTVRDVAEHLKKILNKNVTYMTHSKVEENEYVVG
ncbi:tyrosine-type recombinase/integrase [bacterium]|nr:tyrosine-type recombinase/integrase [bacterium]